MFTMGDFSAMSTPPPHQTQPYGYQHPQQPYGQPQPMPGAPQPPRRNPLRAAINIVVLFAVIGGVVWWVVDYNTNPNGGKAAEQASASASAEAYNKRHNPQVGDCVKVTGSEDDNTLQMTIVGCGSSEAQYKTAEVLTGAQECKPETVRAISLRGRHAVSTRWCFSKI
ncbi:hypothetical protein ACF05W_14065 [Streptomyces lydicus]|uniref:LppU/SCO3897 family protein n=1 Tax=Streptomyces lydicus TaxID=47763 RepID=UPI0036FE099A